VDVADLEPDVGDLQRLGRVLGDRREAAERALAVALLLEDEAEAVADLAPLLEGGVDLEDVRERLLGVVQAVALLVARQHQRAVPLVQEADAVPEVGVVGRAEVRIAGDPSRIQLARGIESEGLFPSADCLFRSMGKECGPGAIGVVLAGRGYDGALGAKSLLQAGGTCLVQSPGSGYPEQMTQAAVRHAPSSRQIPLEKLGDTLCRYIGELSRQLNRSQDGSVA